MNMPAPAPTIWTTGTTTVLKTGTWRAALPVYQAPDSPCHAACPVGGRIAQWMQQARAGDWHGAWLTLTENNPFPAIAGRVCHHPCEAACNRGGYDAPLAVCALERHIGDRALAEGWRHAPVVVERPMLVPWRGKLRPVHGSRRVCLQNDTSQQSVPVPG